MVNSSYCNELFNSYEQRYIWLSPVLQGNSGIAAKRPCQEYKEYSIDSWFWYQTVKKGTLQWSHRIQYHSRPSIEVHHIPRANAQRGKDCSRPENISLWWVNVAEMSEPSLEGPKVLRPKVWMLNISGVPTWFARYFRRFSSAQQRSGSAIIHTSPVGIATSAPLLLTSSDPGLQNKTDFTGATWKSQEMVQQILMNSCVWLVYPAFLVNPHLSVQCAAGFIKTAQLYSIVVSMPEIVATRGFFALEAVPLSHFQGW